MKISEEAKLSNQNEYLKYQSATVEFDIFSTSIAILFTFQDTLCHIF